MSARTGFHGAGVRKIKAAFGGKYIFNLHNIRINGAMRGCSGYIQNPETHKTIYLTTESTSCRWLDKKLMFRIADDIGKDGEWNFEHKNQWVSERDFAIAAQAELDADRPLLRY